MIISDSFLTNLKIKSFISTFFEDLLIVWLWFAGNLNNFMWCLETLTGSKINDDRTLSPVTACTVCLCLYKIFPAGNTQRNRRGMKVIITMHYCLLQHNCYLFIHFDYSFNRQKKRRHFERIGELESIFFLSYIVNCNIIIIVLYEILLLLQVL